MPNPKTPAEIAKSLSTGMRREIATSGRLDRWPYPLDIRSAEALRRRGLVSLKYPTRMMCLTDLGRAVAAELESGGQ